MPVSLTRRGWGFVLGAGVSVLAATFVELRDFWYIPAFLIAVPVVAVLTTLLFRIAAQLEVRLTAANPTPHAGSTVALTASLTHRLPIAIEARVDWLIEGETASTDVVIPRGAPARITHQWQAVERGPASVRVLSVLIADPLGIAVAALNCGDRASLEGALVLPRLLEEVPESAETHSHGDSALPPNTHIVQDSGAPGGTLRKYRPGDAKRMVDWKQSARQRELLVRIAEADEANARRVTILTDAASHASRKAFEFAISEAATIAVAWLRKGDVVQLIIDDEPPIDSVDEDELLRQLAFLELRHGAYATN